jgi:CHAT domain-containing protein
VEAPAFQSLIVAGEPGGYVDLSAYELADWDLSGLELVTLGACETGLGRFDRGDNLRGLPAMLLLAGAESLVTTLWRVGSVSSRVFFERLHEERRNGASRLDAFAAAQRATRERHPEYRRWGAFTLMGMTT